MKTFDNLLKSPFRAISRLCRRHPDNDFISFFGTYLKSYDRKDYRVMKQAYDKYLLFCSINGNTFQHSTPDHDVVKMFADFLLSSSRGTGAASTFGRFRKAVILATKQGVLNGNPCEGIRCGRADDNLVKDILSEEEISRLTGTHYANESHEIRKAFIFSLYTGIRFCDVKALRHSDIDFANRFVSFRQTKTKDCSSKSMAYIPLREDLLFMIGESNVQTDRNSLLFSLPSHTTCLKHLRKWTKAAGIEKHITWHSARHSFATNILKNGADIRVVAELLGHSSLKYVEKYTRAVNKMKIMAVNSLPPLR